MSQQFPLIRERFEGLKRLSEHIFNRKLNVFLDVDDKYPENSSISVNNDLAITFCDNAYYLHKVVIVHETRWEPSDWCLANPHLESLDYQDVERQLIVEIADILYSDYISSIYEDAENNLV